MPLQVPGSKMDDIVISGLSGRFPECDNLAELKENLLNGVDMVTDMERRWPRNYYGLPARMGSLKNVTHFDAEFFGIPPEQADEMDPQMRHMLEITFEAIVDAGFNPEELRGSNTGVFVGASNDDTGDYAARFCDEIKNGYPMLGTSRNMLANRVSFHFDFKGPSFVVDTACSSSLVAFHTAVSAIRRGECDAAIVGGLNLCLKPGTSVQFRLLELMNKYGICKSFDESGNGYVRSEASVSLLLQKSKNARRAYAYVLNTGTNIDGYKDKGITFPSGDMQKKLLETIYNEINLNPTEVSYVEAHGTGTKAGDPQEVNSIADFFCKGRKGPLLIGSVKSNIGHSEPASGLCSLAKVVIAMEENKIPGNLHFSSPNKDIPALSDGRLQVVDKNESWNGGIVAVNSFGFGGANAHAIIKSNPKSKSPTTDTTPKLVCVSGRTEEAVAHYIKTLEQTPRDDDLLTLIHEIHKQKIVGHKFRGYSVLGSDQNIWEISEELDKKQVWYVYSGVGSQWIGMGRAFMGLKPFKDAINCCAKAVAKEGVDLLYLINQGVDEDFTGMANSMTCIVAIQIALTDLLTELGVSPSGIIGHSAGEICCAYADGALTREKTVLSAYWRGRCLEIANLKPGLMAAVGLSWKEAKARCPTDVFPACHNGADSVTISGAADAVKNFVQQLKSDNIFAKIVESNGIAFHTKFIHDGAPLLLSSLQKVIEIPKLRTSKWLSSSIPESRWIGHLATTCSAEYFVNNLLSPVLFHEVVKKIPDDAIVIEIAPNSLFQSILKNSLPKSCMIASLAKKGVPDELGNFLANIGRLYLAGLHPDLSLFHKPKTFPVSRGTPMIGPMIKWDHTSEFKVADLVSEGANPGAANFEINISEEKDSFITGHLIDGRVLFPATGYLTLVWKAYAKKLHKNIEDLSVTMENISFLRPTIMPKQGSVKFSVNIMSSGNFQLSESGTAVATGRITCSEGLEKDGLKKLPVEPTIKALKELNKSEIYKYMNLRGYEYNGIFKGIKSSDNYGVNGILEWSENWISFMDTMLQFSLLSINTSLLYLPVRMLRITIDPQKHLELLHGKQEIPVKWFKNIKVIRSGGIEIRGMKSSLAPRRTIQSKQKLEQYKFVPYIVKREISEIDALTIALQIVHENFLASKLIVVEAHPIKPKSFLATDIVNILESESGCVVDMTIATPITEDMDAIIEPIDGKHIKIDITKNKIQLNAHLLVTYQIENSSMLENAMGSIRDGGFILTIESQDVNFDLGTVISRIPIENAVFILLRKSFFDWIPDVKMATETENKILLVSDKEPDTGIIGLINCLKMEPGGERFRCVQIEDGNFMVTENMDQLKKDLVINVKKGGEWGSMRHLTIKDHERSLNVKHAYVNTLIRGDLTSLRWIEGPMSFAKPEHQPKKEMCSIYYAPLNFKDVMIASGKLPPDSLPGHQGELECIMGLEFAGRNSKGERIFGMVETQALATSVFADPVFLWPIPNRWTMEEACTVPVVYATSYYSLIMRGQMKAGESVLIHAGAGGVGQASINIALSMGCEIYTTVGSEEKRNFLLKNFPNLKGENIGNSRDASFEQMIMERTNGRGVDLVLNSLSMELLQASIRCLAEHGRFLEIGKMDLANNSALGMAVLLKNITVHGVLLDAIFEADEDNYEKQQITKLLREGIDAGVVKPLPVNIFENTQIEDAFRFMASGKHLGKVVIKIRNEEDSIRPVMPKPAVFPAVPRTYFNPDKSYILIGGLGGFGLELTQWMFIRGAKHIVLVSRSGVTTGYQALCIRNWEEKGHKVTIFQSDVTTKEQALNLINIAISLAPIGGIFNLAAILKDAYFENQTIENFKAVCKSKVDTTRVLDAVSRTSCPLLDHFIVFSSIACGRGNAGQTNYGMANSCMERICEQRQADGFPGTAIQWGPIGDVGLVIDNLKGDNNTVIGGALPQRISSCIATIDLFIQYPYPIMASMVLPDKRKKTKDTSFNITDAVANLLGIKNVKSISNTSTLSDIGIDSLMGAEIKQLLERNYDIIMNPSEIRSLTFEKLNQLSQGQEIPKENENKEKILVDFKTNTLMPDKPLIIMKESIKEPKRQTFFIHAIEGNVASLYELAQATSENDEIYGLQCTEDAPLESIEQLAAFYIWLMKKVQPDGPYRLVGYSFGAGIAIEMTIQLEQEKNRVQLTLLDGAHSFVATHVKYLKDNRSLVPECSAAFAYFISIFDPAGFNKILAKISRLSTTEEKLDLTASIIRKIVPFDKDDIKKAAISFYDKILAADKYVPAKKITGDITLIKSSDKFLEFKDDYGISEICTGKLTIHRFERTHRSIVQGSSAEKIAQLLSS